VQELRTGKWSAHTPPGRPIAGFDASNFEKYSVNGYFDDTLLCSLPETLAQGPFELNFGCLLSAKNFVHLIMGTSNYELFINSRQSQKNAFRHRDS